MLPWLRCLVVCLFVFAQCIDSGTKWQRCIPGPSCSLSEHPTSQQDNVFRLFAIDLKKKIAQKRCNNTICPKCCAAKTWRECCRETSSSTSVPGRRQHVLLNIQERRVLHRHCSRLHCYYYFVQVMQLLCPPPTSRRSSRLSFLLAGLPPHSHSRLSHFFLPSPQHLAVQTQVSLRLLGH